MADRATVPPPAQSAAIPYRLRDGQAEVLLVTTRGKGRWIVPKGNVEPELGPRRSAAREAFEEAGVSGPVGADPLGRYRHGRAKKAPEVEVYLLHVEAEAAEWPEAAERRRRWFPVEKAGARIGVVGLRALLYDAAELLRGRAPRPGEGPGRAAWPTARAA
jgi:8-oxo-dGTP pyrophosphatase MutT (NUDIX family)